MSSHVEAWELREGVNSHENMRIREKVSKKFIVYMKSTFTM